MFSSVNNVFYHMSRVSLGSLGGPETPGPPPRGGGPQGVMRSKRILRWGKSVFLNDVNSSILLFTDKNAILKYVVILF